MITIVDYGMGNLRSVSKAFESQGADVKISSKPRDIDGAEKIVLPGVGAFGDAMRELKKHRLVEALKRNIKEGKPFLGLCLGLQLLFETSDESPGVKGLGIFKGKSVKFRKKSIKVPHMGWNNITMRKKSRLFKNVKNGSFFYFVHSFFVSPKDKTLALAFSDYSGKFVCAVEKDNVFGLQFHPEKSQRNGLKVIRNFTGLKIK
jgi:glutamine amidotransferase